jgi:hypothetical protein
MGNVSTPRAETGGLRAGGLLAAMSLDAQPVTGSASGARFDVCPVWLDFAIRHLSDAQVARDARIGAWRESDEHSRTAALEWEFEASLQAIMASAIAVDAFYAAVQTRVPLPQSLIDEWRDKKAPRHVRISDVFGDALSLDPKSVSGLREALAEIFRFRDLAVDPSGKMGAEVLHPELGVGVEWRFAYFRHQNALVIVTATVRLIAELAASGHPKDPDLRKYIDALRSKVEPLQSANALRVQAQKLDI